MRGRQAPAAAPEERGRHGARGLKADESQERHSLVMRGRDTPAASSRSRCGSGSAWPATSSVKAVTPDTGSSEFEYQSQSELEKKCAELLKQKCKLLEEEVKATKENTEAKMLLTGEVDKIKYLEYLLAVEENKSKNLEVQKPSRLNASRALELRLEELDMAVARTVEENNRMRNELQDLKGTIRVFARFCPLKGNDRSIFSKSEDNDCTIKLLSKNKSYNFDKVFDDEVQQADLFEHIKDLVKRSLANCKVCIMAYGQSGSGKTFTMIGKNNVNDDQASGLVPRTGKFILDNITANQILKMSVYEVYNETVRDLLKRGDDKGLKVLHDDNQVPNIIGLTAITVTSAKDFNSILEQAVSSRSTAQTKINETSSRSHCVFQFNIFDATDKDLGAVTLIDLAGSENAKSAGATGTTLTESNKINLSLLALQNVLINIAEKETGHIPFRGSVLTKILEPYLKSGARVIMIMTASQQKSKMRQSEKTFDFAMKVKKCHISELFSPGGERRKDK